MSAPRDDQYFIATKTDFLCGRCNDRTKEFDITDPAVQVWEFYSQGWLGPCICKGCHLSIPVYIDVKGKKAA